MPNEAWCAPRDRTDMDAETTRHDGGDAASEPVVVRRSGQGWRVGPEETADLTSAMVLADLLAADLGSPTVPLAAPPSGPPSGPPAGPASVSEADEAARLAVTVAQLEHALSARVRVEQAIGVLAERHRLRPRQALVRRRSFCRVTLFVRKCQHRLSSCRARV